MRDAAYQRPLLSFAPAFAALTVALLAATPLRAPDSTRQSAGGYMAHPVLALEDRAEHVIIIGGIVLERNRHLAAGSVIGCTVGAGFGAGAAGVLAFATGGAALAAIPAASALGCAVFGAAGGMFGAPLDDYQMDLSDLDDGAAH
jgi:hypothetical protein